MESNYRMTSADFLVYILVLGAYLVQILVATPLMLVGFIYRTAAMGFKSGCNFSDTVVDIMIGGDDEP